MNAYVGELIICKVYLNKVDFLKSASKHGRHVPYELSVNHTTWGRRRDDKRAAGCVPDQASHGERSPSCQGPSLGGCKSTPSITQHIKGHLHCPGVCAHVQGHSKQWR